MALHPFFKNIQTSWAKMGNAGAAACLSAGCNDFGGTLMNESISKAAGGENGQELPPKAMEKLIRSQKRVPRQRTTLYARAATERVTVSMKAAPLTPIATSGPTKGVFRKLSEPEAMTTFGTLQTSSEPEAPL